MNRVRKLMRAKVTQFFCTRPLVVFLGIIMVLKARSNRSVYFLEEWPTWVVNASSVVGFAAGIIALWVMFAPAPHLLFRKWMGWALLSYWAVRGIGSLLHAAQVSDGFLNFTEAINGFYAWTIIAVLGLLMIVAPNPYHLWDESHGQERQKKGPLQLFPG